MNGVNTLKPGAAPRDNAVGAVGRAGAAAGGANSLICHVHAFRAFAIISIVAAHAFRFPLKILPEDAAAGAASAVHDGVVRGLFHGGTLYFSLISGVLFSLVLKRRGWAQFFGDKLAFVLAPYLFMSAVLMAISWNPNRGMVFIGEGFANFLGELPRAIWTGSASGQFWYIPVLAALYAATPAVNWLVEDRRRGWVVAALALAPLIVTRTGAHVSANSIVYFLGAYSIGVWIGANYDAAMASVRRHRAVLVAIFCAASAALFLLQRAEIDSVGPVSLLESAYYIQKMALGVIVLDWLKRREAETSWLNSIATYSFAIFFLHIAAIAVVGRTAQTVFGSPDTILLLLAWGLGLLIAAIGLSLAASMLVKRLLGRRSRWFIGS